MTQIRRTLLVAVITVGPILLGTAVWLSQGQATRSPEKITMAEASQAVFALVYIAEAKGFFSDEGLEVAYRSFTSGRDALASVIAGESDIATVFVTPVVLRASAGEALSVITTLHSSTQNTALVARRDRGIATPSDLRGKKIAVTKRTNGEYFLFAYLTSLGIDLAEVTFVDTSPQDMAQVLKDGTVDAVATWNPHLYDARREFSLDRIVTMSSEVYTEMSVLAGRRELVANRKEALKRLLRALVRAEQYIQSHEDEAIQIVIAKLPQQPSAAIRGVWHAFKAELKLNNVLLTVLEEEAKWFKERDYFAGPLPNFRNMLFSDSLRDAKPEGVTFN